MMKKLTPAPQSTAVTTNHSATQLSATPKRHKLAMLDDGSSGPKKAIRKPRAPSSNFPGTVAKQVARSVCVNASIRADAASLLASMGEHVVVTMYTLAKNSASANGRQRPNSDDVKVACLNVGIKYNPRSFPNIEAE
jgi:histone H3/H4